MQTNIRNTRNVLKGVPKQYIESTLPSGADLRGQEEVAETYSSDSAANPLAFRLRSEAPRGGLRVRPPKLMET
jgi:hypothetical protein